MKIKNILENYAGLLKQREKTYTAKLGYAISYNAQKMKQEIDVYEKERIKLCEKYAKKDEKDNAIIKDNMYEISEERKLDLHKEIEEILETDVNVNILKIDRKEIEKCEESERYDIPSVKDLEDLMFMLKDE